MCHGEVGRGDGGRNQVGRCFEKNDDLDRLCRLSSNEFKPATNRIDEYGKRRVKLKIVCKARFCINSKCCDWVWLMRSARLVRHTRELVGLLRYRSEALYAYTSRGKNQNNMMTMTRACERSGSWSGKCSGAGPKIDWAGAERERERGVKKIRWGESGAGGGGRVSGSGAASRGYWKRCQRWAEISIPFPLRSHALIWPQAFRTKTIFLTG